MGYSEAAMEGQRRYGRRWRKTLRGLPDICDRFNNACAAEDLDGMHSAMRDIAAFFRPHVASENEFGNELEALEFFEEETGNYELENGNLNEFVEECNFRLQGIYDWADYNRVSISPERSSDEQHT